MDLNAAIDTLARTKPATISKLRSVGINTYQDLINYFPFRYENYSLISPIAKLQPGENVTIKAQVSGGKLQISRTGLRMQKFTLADATGKIDITWYNQPYLLRLLKPKMFLAVAGVVKQIGRVLELEPREYEIIAASGQNTIHTGRIVPVYSETRGLSSKTIREKLWNVLNATPLPEILPKEILVFNQLIDRNSAYRQIHFPANQDRLNQSRRRLAFEEIFFLQLSSALIKKAWSLDKTPYPLKLTDVYRRQLQQLADVLPFQLTSAQQKCIKEITADLVKKQPMNRLLQGDVGSGKTVVAAIAAYLAFLNHSQTLLMAPTEILAQQHFNTVNRVFEKIRPAPKVALQTGSIKMVEKSDGFDLVVGTHALLNRNLKTPRLGLIVIDEQHRFGVEQRSVLKNKGKNVHLLTMTATPIPRTVALTLYGELDISLIDEMPKGRVPIKTYLVGPEKRRAGYDWIKKQIKENRSQVFIICPLIEESTVETMQSVKAAKQEFVRLQKEIFSEYTVGLIHGKLKSQEKQSIMESFKNQRLDILVATSLVEVGIDVPNASIMIIEAAERFGLAQLHQLRGRVGRGQKQSYCFLFTENLSEKIKERLNFFVKNNSGLQLSQYDLQTRGEGELFGKKQHGKTNLKIASFSDYQLIDRSQKAVTYFVNRYEDTKPFPELDLIIKKMQSKLTISPD